MPRPYKDHEVISFVDPDARSWLIRRCAERMQQTGHNVDLSTIARRVFAIGRVMVERYPEMLDLRASAGLLAELDEALRPYLGIPSTANLDRALLKEVPDG